jgi:hypothetical protein
MSANYNFEIWLYNFKICNKFILKHVINFPISTSDTIHTTQVEPDTMSDTNPKNLPPSDTINKVTSKVTFSTDKVCKKQKTGDTKSIIRKKKVIKKDKTIPSKKEKKARGELITWLGKFERKFEYEACREMDGDAPGDIMWDEGKETYTCALTSMQDLLEKDMIEEIGGEDCAVMEFMGADSVCKFPEMLEKLAKEFLEGASIARRAGLDLPKHADESDEDATENDEDDDDDENEDEEDDEDGGEDEDEDSDEDGVE